MKKGNAKKKSKLDNFEKLEVEFLNLIVGGDGEGGTEPPKKPDNPDIPDDIDF